MAAWQSVDQFIEANPHLYCKLCDWASRRKAAHPIKQVRAYLRELVLEAALERDPTGLLNKWASILSLQERNGLAALSPIAIKDYANPRSLVYLAEGGIQRSV
jgi:hypothetical protein